MTTDDGILRLRASHRLALARLPNALIELFTLDEQRAVVITSPQRVAPALPVPVRLQSACLYGEVLESDDCDCREQLEMALDRIRDRGGLVIHLDQEGRGAGLVNKAIAYETAERYSLDTVAAYERCDLEIDSREYSIAAHILQRKGIDRVALMTNQERKVAGLQEAGITVDRESLQASVTDGNRRYLRTKKTKLGHDLALRADDAAPSDAARVVVIGAAVTDHLLRMTKNPVAGAARQAKSYQRRPGGKGLNQAVALSRLGASVGLVAEIGTDADAMAINDTLRREMVRALPADVTSDHKTPQTIVVQPERKPPMFIGWLGDSRRSLTSESLQKFSSQLLEADAVSLTLELSGTVLSKVRERVPESTLVALNASPIADDMFQIEADALERVDLLVGSFREIRALMAERIDVPADDDPENLMILARESAAFLEATVIVTSFRDRDRGAVAALPSSEPLAPGEDPVLAVRGSSPSPSGSGAVAAARSAVSAVGNTDAFCAALIITLVEAAREGGGKPATWGAATSPLRQWQPLADALSVALEAESYVARPGPGPIPFPTGEELKRWSRTHHAEATFRTV